MKEFDKLIEKSMNFREKGFSGKNIIIDSYSNKDGVEVYIKTSPGEEVKFDISDIPYIIKSLQEISKKS